MTKWADLDLEATSACERLERVGVTQDHEAAEPRPPRAEAPSNTDSSPGPARPDWVVAGRSLLAKELLWFMQPHGARLTGRRTIEILPPGRTAEIDLDELEDVKVENALIGSELTFVPKDGPPVALYGIDADEAETLRRAVINAGERLLAERTDQAALMNAERTATEAGLDRLVQAADVERLLAKTRHPGIPTHWPAYLQDRPLTNRLDAVRAFSEDDPEEIRRRINDTFIGRHAAELADEAIASEERKLTRAVDDGRLTKAEAAIQAVTSAPTTVQRTDVLKAVSAVRTAGLPSEWPTEVNNHAAAERLRDAAKFTARTPEKTTAQMNDAFIVRHAAELTLEAVASETRKLTLAVDDGRLARAEAAMNAIASTDKIIQAADASRALEAVRRTGLPAEWPLEVQDHSAVTRLVTIAEFSARTAEDTVAKINTDFIARHAAELTEDAVKRERGKLDDPAVQARLKDIERQAADVMDGPGITNAGAVDALRTNIVSAGLPGEWPPEVDDTPTAERLKAVLRILAADTETVVAEANDAFVHKHGKEMASEAVAAQRVRLHRLARTDALESAESAIEKAENTARYLQKGDLQTLRETAADAGLPREWPRELDRQKLPKRLKRVRCFLDEDEDRQRDRLNRLFIIRCLKELTREALDAERRRLADRTDTAALVRLEKMLDEVSNPRRYLSRRRMDGIKKAVDRTDLPEEWPREIRNDDLPKRLAAVLRFRATDVDALRTDCNRRFMNRELQERRTFLDSVEKRPLSDEQRTAVCRDDDVNLVVAGAGSGKTSVIVAKAGLAIERGDALADEILVLAFGREARNQLQHRIAERLGDRIARLIDVKTFHELGLGIIGDALDEKPSVPAWAGDAKAQQRLVETKTRAAIADGARGRALRRWIAYGGPPREQPPITSMDDYRKYTRSRELRTLNRELVKSQEELAIANFLFIHQVPYKYEAPYKLRTTTHRRSQYKPDFHLTGTNIYIEHFAINSDGHTPPFIEEEEYLEGRTAKKRFHETNGTTLIETFSHENTDDRLTDRLKSKLAAHGIPMKERPPGTLLDAFNEGRYVSGFAKLATTFLRQAKGAGRTPADVAADARRRGRTRTAAFAEAVGPIHDAIEADLARDGELDFEDMINTAADYVESGRWRSPYKCVLVDEFQDISQMRAKLLRGLAERRSGARLFAVGDDRQAIFRFAGADLSLMTDFPRHFGEGAVTELRTTFRCGDGIAAVADEFISKNPNQLPRTTRPARIVPGPGVKVGLGETDDLKLLHAALKEITAETAGHPKGPSVLILARYNRRIRDLLQPLKRAHRRLNLTAKTVHGAKGLEADYCIVIGMRGGGFGFPSEIEDDPILDAVRAEPETYPHAEERRLFYVALTRARVRAYVIEDKGQPSVFVEELLLSSTGRVERFRAT